MIMEKNSNDKKKEKKRHSHFLEQKRPSSSSIESLIRGLMIQTETKTN